MRYLALATDYDGTLAHRGEVDEATFTALARLRESGRKLVLVTGRELDELTTVCPRLDLFDRVVAENGALLYRPAWLESKVLAARPPESFVEALRARGVTPISVGRVVVAAWRPHETTIAEVIGESGLDLRIVLNKRAVMVLPAGVTKASGLVSALEEIGVSPSDVVAVGDAENDLEFMALCGCSAAVANALDVVKRQADIVTQGDHGPGVAEVVALLLDTDLIGARRCGE